jgi:hypothetical protein
MNFSPKEIWSLTSRNETLTKEKGDVIFNQRPLGSRLKQRQKSSSLRENMLTQPMI